MPSSSTWLVPWVVDAVARYEGRNGYILDVGPGNGKYGVLMREYIEPRILDAVESEPRYLGMFPWNRCIYDRVFVGDVCGDEWRLDPDDTLPLRPGWQSYVMVLMLDVLEHLDHDAGEALLRRIPGRVVVLTPRDFFQNPEADQGWESERHRSVWTHEELAAIRHVEYAPTELVDSVGAVLAVLGPLGPTP